MYDGVLGLRVPEEARLTGFADNLTMRVFVTPSNLSYIWLNWISWKLSLHKR